MVQIISVAIVSTIFNYCYTQNYHNANVSKRPEKGMVRFIKPLTPKRVSLFFVMLAIMVVISIHIYEQNPEENIWYVLKRVSCLGMLFPAAAIDAKVHKIPNKLLLAYLGMRVVILMCEAVFYSDVFLDMVINEAISVVLILVIAFGCRLVVKNGICMGDIKLMALMAMLLGSQSLINALFVSMWICFFEAVGLMLIKKKSKKDSIAFAPSVFLGTMISMFLIGS